MGTLLAMLLLAAPPVGSTWKGHWQYTVDAVATATVGGKKQRRSAGGSINAPLSIRIDAAGEKLPTELTVQSRALYDQPITLRNDGGGASVIVKKGGLLPADDDAKRVWRFGLGRLVLDDPEREAMSSCTDKTAAATEAWLKRISANLYYGDPYDTKLANVSVKCAMKKGRAVHDVAWDATVNVGVVVYQLTGIGTVTVDPALWVTTWSFGGPLNIDSNSRSELKAKGRFKSRFEVSK